MIPRTSTNIDEKKDANEMSPRSDKQNSENVPETQDMNSEIIKKEENEIEAQNDQKESEEVAVKETLIDVDGQEEAVSLKNEEEPKKMKSNCEPNFNCVKNENSEIKNVEPKEILAPKIGDNVQVDKIEEKIEKKIIGNFKKEVHFFK
jgi:hypothetical protein